MQSDWEKVMESLQQMTLSLKEMTQQLRRMPEQCDPYIFYHRVRICLSGWKNSPSYPNGVIFEGVNNNGTFESERGEFETN